MRIIMIAVIASALASLFGTAGAEIANANRNLTVRFPAFALSPGERISGVRLTASAGSIYAGCRPNRWTCETNDHSIHCFSLHPTYATAISGMLPEFIIRNSTSVYLSLDATVEFIDNDGKEYSRQIREEELIVR
jgi:hypothetical protein